jgi:hypothetical protein
VANQDHAPDIAAAWAANLVQRLAGTSAPIRSARTMAANGKGWKYAFATGYHTDRLPDPKNP